MGRITIFALNECPHCKRAKAALTAHNIPYTEISLSDYPDKRSDMLALSDRLTVPQIFFNDEHIGGADETLAILSQWDKEDKYPTALERYEAEIAVQDAPKDERLQPPTTPPIQPKPEPSRSNSDFVELPNGEKMSVLELTKKLKMSLPKEKLGYRGKYYFNVFTGSDGTAALMKAFDIKEEVNAVEFGNLLRKRKLINHVTSEHSFANVKNLYYRLQAYSCPLVLNTFRIWTDRVDPDSHALLIRLKKLMGKIESDCTNKDGLLDYEAATKHVNYDLFEESICELQGVSLNLMVDDEKLAFGINLYNVMIKHAFMKVGIPKSTLSRLSFFGSVGYNIGGNVYSFSELENGILRSNKKAPGHLSPHFSSDDPRLAFVVSKVDPRIHFALNCGAKSCPPVKTFSAQAINEELRIVAQAFCEQDDNVGVDENHKTLSLSKIMSWYLSDFASSTTELPNAIVTYLRGEKKEKLQRLIDSKTSIKVVFNSYDWNTNVSNSIDFKKSNQVLTKYGLTF